MHPSLNLMLRQSSMEEIDNLFYTFLIRKTKNYLKKDYAMEIFTSFISDSEYNISCNQYRDVILFRHPK